MRILILFLINLLFFGYFTDPIYAKDYCKRFPSDTAVECYTPSNPPPASPTSPASPDGSIQYNDSGVFGGSANATLDASGNTFIGGDLLIAKKVTISAGSNPMGPNTLDVSAVGADNGAMMLGTDFAGIYTGASDGISSQNYVSIGVPALAAGPSINSLDVGAYDFGGGTYIRNSGIAVGKTYAGLLNAPDDGMIVEGLVGFGTGATVLGTNFTVSGAGNGAGTQMLVHGTNDSGGVQISPVSGHVWEFQATSDTDGVPNAFFFYDRTAGAYRFLIKPDGKMGVNTTSPSYQFDVNGNGRYSGALTLDSTLIDGGGNAGGNGDIYTSTVTGTLWKTQASLGFLSGLTTNKVLKATSATTAGNSQIFDDATNVGIGTTVPVSLLDVNRKINILTGGNVGIGSITPGQKFDVQGTIRSTAMIDTGLTASTFVYSDTNKQLSSGAISTGLTNTTGTLTSNAVEHLSYQPGLLTAVNATIGVYYKASKASTVDNIIGSAVTFSCVANPTVTMYECGTSATCASSPVTIGTVTVTAAGTATVGTVSNSAITAGDYIGFAMTAGTCASIDIAVNSQIHAN